MVDDSVIVRKQSGSVWTIIHNGLVKARFVDGDDVQVGMLVLSAQHLASELGVKTIDFEMSHTDIERIKRVGLPKPKLLVPVK